MAAKYNFKIDQGSDFSMTLRITQSDGSLLPSTGYDARAHIRADDSPTGALIDEFTCTFDTDGDIVMSLTNAETAAIPAGRYFWDVEVYTAGDVSVKRWLQGRVQVTQEMTRP